MAATYSSAVVVTTRGHKISWKIGDIAKEQAHTLVSPQGVISKAIFSAAGPDITKIYQAPQPGEITKTPGFLLVCSHVIHTNCSKWDGGKGEATLRSIVQKSLVEVNDLGGNSVAFPVIGTGKLAFPPKEASRIMLEEAVAFCKKNPNSLVKEIRFILFHGNQAVIDAFKQESAALRAKNRKTVEVVQGDLTQERTDAIVNIIGTDMNINGAGELGKAVAKASGAQVEDECIKLGQQPPGSTVMTSGGNLAVPYIIHMVVGSSAKQHLQVCVEKCLQLADAKGLKKISLPAVGTGAGGLSDVDSAQAVFNALRNILKTCINLRQVRIVLYQAKLMEAYQKEQKLMQQKKDKQPVFNPSPVKTEESPRKKARMTQDGKSDPINLTGDSVLRRAMTLPTTWDPMPVTQAGNDVTVHTVTLSSTSREYQDVALKFQQTAGSVAIVSIERIQNPHLYQAYQLRKEKMDKDNGGNNERQLFHGTNVDNVTKINTQGFNRSFSGLNGTALGKGVYFARDASYSLSFAARSGASVGNRCMYLSRVLVGQYCKGTSAMVVPPPKESLRPEILFDSAVDDTSNPTIFVVFHDIQCYPEYLIKF